jgi:prephenate dehydrogenase
MRALEIKHITVIGVGLLGGSVALAARRKYGAQVAGVGRRRQSIERALAAGLIDTAHLDPVEPAAKSDLVILATPVCAFERHLRAIAPVLRPGCLVTDVGSTKAVVVAAARKIFRAGRCPFVGSHPMAGSERRGPMFARPDLLQDATCVVTPIARNAAGDVSKIERFWSDLGMRVVRMSPARHDQAVAVISHLPHALSVLLMLLPDDEAIKLSAGGFRDMTRLSGGDVEVWRDIFLTNRGAILRAMDRFGRSMRQLRKIVSAGDVRKLEKLFTQARQRREGFAAGKNSA